MEKNRGLIILLSSVGVLFAVVLTGLFFFYPRPKTDNPVAVVPSAVTNPQETPGTPVAPVNGTVITANPLDGSQSLEATPGLQPQKPLVTGVVIDPSAPSRTSVKPTVAFPTATTPPKPVKPVASAPVKPQGKVVTVIEYWIQVGAYKDRYQADTIAKSLESSHLKGSISTAGTGDQIKYRVRFGPYPNKPEAEKFLTWLKPQKYFESAYVTEVPAKRTI